MLLAGLIAVALPVIIHFLTRPRPRRVLFPTYRFLVEAASGKQALHRLRTWLVLTLRCLAVAMLVLLFAKPFLQRRFAATQTDVARRVVIIIDATLSMKGVQGGVTLFDKAKAEAAELMRSFDADTTAGVIFLKAKAQSVLPALSANIPALHERLQAAAPGSAFGDPASALALADQMLNGPGTIYIFSDFQRTNWYNLTFTNETGSSIILRPVTEEPIENIAVTGIHITPPIPVAGEPVEINCTLFNSTGTDRQEPVVLMFSGERLSQIVNVRPFSSTNVSFSVIAGEAGEFEGKIEIGRKDGLNDDNKRFFILKVLRESVVLVISDEDADDLSGSAFFIRTAIEPYSDEESGIKAVLRHSQDTDIHVLDRADTYIVSPPAVLSEEVAAAITSRVLEGATLICFLDGPKAPAILEALSIASDGKIVPPFQVLTRTTSTKQDGEPLIDIDYTRDPLKLFASPEQGDLALLRFTRYCKTDIITPRKDEILMFYPDGSAALAVSKSQRGTVVYINFPASPDGGNLVQSPLFPALLHECLRFGGGDDVAHEARPGMPWELIVPTTGDDQGRLSLNSPDGREVEYSELSLGNRTKLTISQAETPGIYPVSRNGSVVALGVVNIDPRESDTRQIPVQELTQQERDKTGNIPVIAYTADQLKVHKEQDLWPLAWILLAVFLGGEMLVLAVWRR